MQCNTSEASINLPTNCWFWSSSIILNLPLFVWMISARNVMLLIWTRHHVERVRSWFAMFGVAADSTSNAHS